MSARRALVAAVVVLVAITAAAWAVERISAASGQEVYRVEVVRDGRVVRSFTLEQLRELGTAKVHMQGKDQVGPPVRSVLESSGVDEFSGLEFRGKALRDSGSLSLERDAIDDEVLLAIADRGTVKVCGPDIPQEERVRDVTQIIVH